MSLFVLHPLLFFLVGQRRYRWCSALGPALAVGLWLSGTGVFIKADEPVDFNRDVRPLLSNNCLACHGFDEGARSTELRLDTREGAITDLGGYAAVVPGKPEKSVLLNR